MNNWPPCITWTSKSTIYGCNHFVATNYGLDGDIRWVNLVSVLDGDIRFRIHFIELSNSSNWEIGWNNELNLNSVVTEKPSRTSFLEIKQEEIGCLHLSNDSGLTIPVAQGFLRKW